MPNYFRAILPELTAGMEEIEIGADEDDELIWTANSNGVLNMKEAYHCL